MSKHPIPDWLRSQFSRIEDEVRKLGPCGVFTQMRTVTQTYFEQQAAAPQPPALSGEPEVMGYGYKDECTHSICMGQQGDLEPLIRLSDHRTHLAPLQAEIERQRKVKIILSEKLQNALDNCSVYRVKMKEQSDLLQLALQMINRGIVSFDDQIEFRNKLHALSKPAGSEKV